MIPTTSDLDHQVRVPQIKVRTETGKPAKIDEQDHPLAATATVGDAEGTIENKTTYTEGNRTGTMFDLVIKAGPSGAGASTVQLSADADNDAGETRFITEDYNHTATDAEAGAFDSTVPHVIEPLP